MMGSSGQQVAILDGILAIITNPDMVQKNLLALKEKISQSEKTVSLAREEQSKVKGLIDHHSVREKELDQREIELQTLQQSCVSERTNLDAYSADLLAREAAVKETAISHVEILSDLNNRSVLLKSQENDLKGRYKELNVAHDLRVGKLDQRERDLIEREQKLSDSWAEIKAKMDKLKEIAG